jgi:short subunit dehydrogenase-like uncharacterized protein
MTRNFDVIVFGATGYTGRLVAEHLLKIYGASGPVKWAMAGRSQVKLEEVRAEIGAPASVPLVIADSNNTALLAAMAAQTKALITTAGPYQLYGDGVVAACAKAGTDYVDLTGESNWIADKIRDHDAEAKASGARLVFSCGFDSIPFDVGVYFAQAEAKKQFGAYAPRVRARVRSLRGGLSGGTLASGVATQAAIQKNPAIVGVLMNPFALTPGFIGPEQPDANTPYEDTVAGSWVGPFMMAAINSKTVHRDNFLLGHRWGRDFKYDEMTMTAGPQAPAGPSFQMGGNMPKPGEGPTRKEREEGFYDILFIAEYPDGRTLRANCKGDMDPGYGSTSKMIAEAALALVQDVPHTQTPGGCWSPAAAMGDALIARLPKKAGVTFNVE